MLAHLTDAIGREVSGGVELEVTNEELANAANITPFTASRIVSEWQTAWGCHEATWPHRPALPETPFPTDSVEKTGLGGVFRVSAKTPPDPVFVVALAQRQAAKRRVIVVFVCDFSKIRILIVDDSAIWRAFLIRHLHDAGLKGIDVAYDGVQAVFKARTVPVDLILMDVGASTHERHRRGCGHSRRGSHRENRLPQRGI